MKNEPYFKVERDGKVLNPITKNNPFLHDSPNRRERREHLNQPRHRGNNKGNALTVLGPHRYKKTTQNIQQVMGRDKDGNWKRIEEFKNIKTSVVNWALVTETKVITKVINHSLPVT